VWMKNLWGDIILVTYYSDDPSLIGYFVTEL